MLRRRELCQIVFVALDIQSPTDELFRYDFVVQTPLHQISVGLLKRKGCPWSVHKNHKKSWGFRSHVVCCIFYYWLLLLLLLFVIKQMVMMLTMFMIIVMILLKVQP